MAVTHRSIGVAVESSFGSLVASTGLPDKTSLTYESMPVERDPVIIYGEVIASERNDTRDGPYGMPPEPDTVYSGGSRVQRRTGSVELRLDLTSVGAGVANYDSNYLGKLLGGGFKTAKHSATTDTSTSVADVNTFTPSTTSTNYAIGNLIGANYNGRAEYSAVTANNVGGDITISPAVSDTGAISGVIQMLQTWYPSRTGTTEHSLSFRVDGVNFRTYVWGAVLESIAISLDNGRLMADLVYQAACIQDDHSSAAGPIEPVYNSGAPALFRGAYVVVSSTAPTSRTDASTGDTLARTELDCESFTFTITNTLTPKGRSNSIIAMSGMDVSDVNVECSLTLSTVDTTLNNDYFNRQLRQVLIGTGPIGNGLGCALMIPAGYLTTDPSKYDVSGNDIVRQTLNYAQSRFGGDVSNSGAGNSPVRIGLTVGS